MIMMMMIIIIINLPKICLKLNNGQCYYEEVR